MFLLLYFDHLSTSAGSNNKKYALLIIHWYLLNKAPLDNQKWLFIMLRKNYVHNIEYAETPCGSYPKQPPCMLLYFARPHDHKWKRVYNTSHHMPIGEDPLPPSPPSPVINLFKFKGKWGDGVEKERIHSKKSKFINIF